jgi:Leucine-rich repeat (LRR) protein
MRRLYLLLLMTLLIQCKVYDEIKVYNRLDKALKHKEEVVYLNLSYKGLKEFPIDILELTNLETLILSFNGIKEIPSDIDTLTKLKVINLMNNPLEELPRSLANIKSLEKIYLNETMLEEEDVQFLKDSLPDCLVVLVSTS